ncbi:MAG: hypothetical protein NTW19_01550, partial [Planctomycetota bacterium]|nr:hypothetical protein [Planctomycetota bacterium]
RESRSSFSNFAFEELPGTPDRTSLASGGVAHKPDFKVREWVGKKYIFDGDEPIAWVFWNPTEGIELREMKLAPGLMPMVMPCAGIASYDFKPEGDFNVTAQGATFAFNTKQVGKADAFECTANWTLTYAAGQGYVWDKRVKFTANKDKAQTEFQIDDPFFYQLVAPATDKLPAARATLNHTILERADGKLIAFPNAHHCWTDGLADCNKSVIRPDGAIVTVIDGWGVAAEMPSDNTHHFTGGYCHWGLDLHLRAPESPAKGQAFDGHMRYTLWDRERVKKALAAGVLPEPGKANAPELFRHVEPVNGFREILPGLNGQSVRLWTGKYSVDHKVGHGDTTSMLVNAGDIKSRVTSLYGDERPNVWQGSSYWMGPYLAPKYKIGMWVKAEKFTGKVAILVDNIGWPKAREPKTISAELPINGSCDWTYVGFETDMPRGAYSWVVRVDPTGEGSFWVDDVEVSPVPAK